MTGEEYADKLALVGKLRQRASPRNEHAAARIRGFTEGLTGEENPSGVLDNPQYTDDARAGFNAGNWTSIGSDVPGLGSASKAMLMLPAMLRSKSAQILNSKLVPGHATFQEHFKTPGGKLPNELVTPSYNISDKASLVPFGNGMPEFGDPQRNMLLVPKPGTHEPSRNLGHIWDSDVMSPSGDIGETLVQRQELLKLAHENAKISLGPNGHPGWKTFEEHLNDPGSMVAPYHFGEMKLYKDQPITPENFSGVLLSNKEGPRTKAIIQQLRERGLPHALADFEKPEEMFGIANWLQKQSIK